MVEENPFLSQNIRDFLQDFYFPTLLHQKRLLWGEASTGKTLFSTLFLIYLRDYRKIPIDQITVADFGPTRTIKGEKSFGGRISDFFPASNEPSMSIIPARMSAKNSNDVIQACCHNFQETYSLLIQYIAQPTPILLINDVSIFLHIGGFRTLIRAIQTADTVLVNGYGGNFLLTDYQSGISARETRMMTLLRKHLVNRQTDADFLRIMQNLYHQLIPS